MHAHLFFHIHILLAYARTLTPSHVPQSRSHAHTIQCYCRDRFLFLLSLGWISLSPVFCHIVTVTSSYNRKRSCDSNFYPTEKKRLTLRILISVNSSFVHSSRHFLSSTKVAFRGIPAILLWRGPVFPMHASPTKVIRLLVVLDNKE